MCVGILEYLIKDLLTRSIRDKVAFNAPSGRPKGKHDLKFSISQMKMQTKTWRGESQHLATIYIPEIGDLIFKANAKPFFDLLKLVPLLVSDCAYTVGSANIERSWLPLKLNLPAGNIFVGIQDGSHWFDGEEGESIFFFFFFVDWDDVHKQTRGCITHEWNRYSSRTYIQTNQPQETKRKERINQLNPSKDDRRRWSDLSRLHNSTTNQDKSCNSNNWTNAKLIQDKHVWLEELHTTIHIYI
jgi:hypothetical protein